MGLCIVYAFEAFKRVSKHEGLIMGVVGEVYIRIARCGVKLLL